MNKKHLLLTICAISIISILITSTSNVNASSLKFNGSKGYVTIWFDHAFSSQIPAIQNMSRDGLTGGILTVYLKENTTGYMTWDQIKQKQTDGWEIISHSMDHKTPTTTSTQSFYDFEEVTSHNLLRNMGINTIGYAFPADIITTQGLLTVNQTYSWAVNGICKQNTISTIIHDEKNRLKLNYTVLPMLHHCGVNTVGVAPVKGFLAAKTLIDQAEHNHTWLVLNFHQIDNTLADYHTTPTIFNQIEQYVKAKSDNGTIAVVSPCQGLGLC